MSCYHWQEEEDHGNDLEDPHGQVYPGCDQVELLPLPSLCLSYSWKIGMATLCIYATIIVGSCSPMLSPSVMIAQ